MVNDHVKKYWLPGDLPEHLRVANSIPGEKPDSLGEHRARLEHHLLELAKQWESEYGRGSAWDIAKEEVPDSNIYEFPETASLEELIDALTCSDLVQIRIADEGDYDEDLQGDCEESDFRDRLSDFVRLA